MNKLAAKLSTFVIASATLFVVTVPAFAAVAIDYVKEQVTGVEPTQEYSFDKKVWTPVYGTALDISNEIGVKSKIYFRNIGETKTTSPTVSETAIPKRDTTSVVTGGVGVYTPNNNQLTVTANTFEYKTAGLNWTKGPSTGYVVVEDAGKVGATFLVRKAADQASSKFASMPKTVAVPKQSTAPSIRYDDTTDSIVGLAPGQEFKIGEGSTYVDVAAGVKSMPRWDKGIVGVTEDFVVGGTAGPATVGPLTSDGKLYFYVRVKGTTAKPASAVAKVQIPDAVKTAPTTPAVEFSDELLVGVDNTMEYRLLTKAEKATATYTTPAWKPISGYEIDMKNLFSTADATYLTALTQLDVRYKAVPASSGELAVPASSPVEIVITKRPATPTSANITIDYPNEKIFAADNTFEYKFGEDEDWTTTVVSTGVSIKDHIPASDSTPGTLYLRKKSAGTVPASLVFTGVKIAKRPAAPTAVFDTLKNQITGVTDKMEFDGDGAAVDGYTGVTAGKNYIDVSAESDTVANNLFVVRIKATTTAPKSEDQQITVLATRAFGLKAAIAATTPTITVGSVKLTPPTPAAGNIICYKVLGTPHTTEAAAAAVAPKIGVTATILTDSTYGAGDWVRIPTTGTADVVIADGLYLEVLEVTPIGTPASTTSGKVVKWGCALADDGKVAITDNSQGALSATGSSITVASGAEYLVNEGTKWFVVEADGDLKTTAETSLATAIGLKENMASADAIKNLIDGKTYDVYKVLAAANSGTPGAGANDAIVNSTLTTGQSFTLTAAAGATIYVYTGEANKVAIPLKEIAAGDVFGGTTTLKFTLGVTTANGSTIEAPLNEPYVKIVAKGALSTVVAAATK